MIFSCQNPRHLHDEKTGSSTAYATKNVFDGTRYFAVCINLYATPKKKNPLQQLVTSFRRGAYMKHANIYDEIKYALALKVKKNSTCNIDAKKNYT